MVVNTYGIAVGIEAIGWRLYLVYIGWIVIEVRSCTQVQQMHQADIDNLDGHNILLLRRDCRKDTGRVVRDLRGQKSCQEEFGEDESDGG